jgi:hypothetical protein
VIGESGGHGRGARPHLAQAAAGFALWVLKTETQAEVRAGRATFNLDIPINTNPDNAQQLLDTFLEANLATATMISAQKSDYLCFVILTKIFSRPSEQPEPAS